MRMPPRWLRRLHRIGYVTTPIVGAQLILIGAVAGWSWRRDMAWRNAERERTRTRGGPLVIDRPRIYRPDEGDLLAALPAPATLAPDGVRFLAMPSLRRTWFGYAITLPRGAGQAKVVLATFDRSYDARGQTAMHVRLTRYTLPAAGVRRWLARFDAAAAGWSGDDSSGVDGTPVAFERIANGRITSGRGSASFSPHYASLSRLTLTPVRAAIPAGKRPAGPDWTPPEPVPPGAGVTGGAAPPGR